ncbi:MAG TPA: GDSL-type esterase/lipase family protein [Verrucomicrobiae bacterium]
MRDERRILLVVLVAVGVARGLSAEETVILDMDAVRHKTGEVTTKEGHKVPIGTVELVEGKFNKAVRFSFTDGVGAGFMTASVQATREWDQAAGMSFYVRGDGSTNWAGLELIDRNDYSLRYAFCFPIDSTEWRKVVLPWGELIPELAGPLIDARSGYAPSGFGNLWFGKWFYWREYPAHAFAIDRVSLETDLPPGQSMRWEVGLKRFRAKLNARQPVTVVTMGDSLTDKRHWANQQTLWAESFAAQLKEKSGCEVRLINPAIGGTTLSQNLVLMPRWLKSAPTPDLVTIWFGGNDWDSGVRGARFREYLSMGVDRIRRLTRGSADVVVLTTCPGFKRWNTLKELEEAAKEVAKQKGTALVDIAGEFRRAGSADRALKEGLWAWDNVHLGTNGHRLTAEAVMRAVQEP